MNKRFYIRCLQCEGLGMRSISVLSENVIYADCREQLAMCFRIEPYHLTSTLY